MTKELDKRNEHYLDKHGKDVWDHLEEMRQSPRELAGAHIKDITKYVIRFDRKVGVSPLVNLEKAAVTLNAFIDLVKRHPEEFPTPEAEEQSKEDKADSKPIRIVGLDQFIRDFVGDFNSELPTYISQFLQPYTFVTAETRIKLINIPQPLYEMLRASYTVMPPSMTPTELINAVHNDIHREAMLQAVTKSPLTRMPPDFVEKLHRLPMEALRALYCRVHYTGKHITASEIIKVYHL